MPDSSGPGYIFVVRNKTFLGPAKPRSFQFLSTSNLPICLKTTKLLSLCFLQSWRAHPHRPHSPNYGTSCWKCRRPQLDRNQPTKSSSQHPLCIPDCVAVLIVTRFFVCKYGIPGAGVFDDTRSSPARIYGLKLAKSIAAHFKDLEGIPHIGGKTRAEWFDNQVFWTVMNLIHREEGWSDDQAHFCINSFHIVKALLEVMIQWAGRTQRLKTMAESESEESEESEEQSVQDDGQSDTKGSPGPSGEGPVSDFFANTASI